MLLVLFRKVIIVTSVRLLEYLIPCIISGSVSTQSLGFLIRIDMGGLMSAACSVFATLFLKR